MEMELEILLVTFLFSVFAFRFLFRVCFHQHQQHLPPSPRWGLPIIRHMHLLDPLLHHSLHRLSLQYGPLFSLRFGSVPCVVASSPHFAKQFLQTNESAFNCRYESAAIKRLTYDSSLAFAPYGDYWRFIKKLSINDLLGSRTINNFRHLRAQETRRLLNVLAQKAQARESVNVTEELLKLSNNVISKMMLGEAEEARDVVRGVTKIFGEFNVSEFIWLFKKFDFQGFGRRTEDLFKRFDTLVERIISKRQEMRKIKGMQIGESLKGENEIKDFLDILLDCAEDKSSHMKLTRVHIKALIMDFFTAGTDTTAISTEWALVELIKNPLLLQKARKEIENIVGKDRIIEESDCANLPYLQAIIKETFRLHPPVPVVTRRCVTDCNIENYVIPKNTLLFVNVWSIGRNPNYWNNPLEFRPERFLNFGGEGDSTEFIDIRGQHFQLLPFGSGRRMCPGVTFVMQLVPTVVGAIIQCFDFQLVDSKGKILKGDKVVIDMDERPGLTAPRAHDLVCVPVEKSSYKNFENLG